MFFVIKILCVKRLISTSDTLTHWFFFTKSTMGYITTGSH